MTTFAWHVHHDRLMEPLTESIEKRQKYIKTFKPTHELALRLRLLKPVKGMLPEAYVMAWKAYFDAWKAYTKAGKAYEKAWNAYEKARKASMPAINALHAKECPNCPWNGQTIFLENISR